MSESRNILVTGAASGIGRRLTTDLADGRHRIVAADIDEEGLGRSAEAEGWNDRRVETARLDVSEFDDWQKTVDDFVDKYGRIDLLVHAAAVAEAGPILEADAASIDRHVDVNVKGTMYGTRVVGAAMAEQGAGHIVNFGSLASLAPVPGLGIYAATKFGVRGVTLAAAQELGEQGVEVTLVMPDTVDTPLLEQQTDSEADVAVAFAGKLLTVDDIAEVFFDRVLPDRPLEAPIPRVQGALTKLATVAPGLLITLRPLLETIGGAKLARYRDRGDER